MNHHDLAKLEDQRERIYSWLMSAYKMPSTLARTIADQHRLGGELVLWAARTAPPAVA